MIHKHVSTKDDPAFCGVIEQPAPCFKADDGMKRTLITDGVRPFPHRKTMLYEVENDVFLAIQIGKMGVGIENLHKKRANCYKQ